MQLREQIEKAWENRELLKQQDTQTAIREVIDQLDKGKLRVAEPIADGWQVNEWVKKAVILYFPIQQMETIEVGPFEFYDKIALKKNYKELGVRVVPHAIARHGSLPLVAFRLSSQDADNAILTAVSRVLAQILLKELIHVVDKVRVEARVSGGGGG